MRKQYSHRVSQNEEKNYFLLPSLFILHLITLTFVLVICLAHLEEISIEFFCNIVAN